MRQPVDPSLTSMQSHRSRICIVHYQHEGGENGVWALKVNKLWLPSFVPSRSANDIGQTDLGLWTESPGEPSPRCR